MTQVLIKLCEATLYSWYVYDGKCLDGCLGRQVLRIETRHDSTSIHIEPCGHNGNEIIKRKSEPKSK